MAEIALILSVQPNLIDIIIALINLIVAGEKYIMQTIEPFLIGMIYVSICSLIKEPARRNFNVVMIAGAGSAYLSGGFGIWEFLFTAVISFCAYQGLRFYYFIGIGWFLHTVWDFLHHLYGHPIIPFLPDSSFGCALCDLVISAWCFAGGPSIFDLFGWKWHRS